MFTNEVHTSCRIAFKRCRRKWNLGSYMRQNLTPIRVNDKLWLGTGIHFALSEYYGKQLDLVETFANWSSDEVKRIKSNEGLWIEQEQMLNEQISLGLGLIDHYSMWCKDEDPKWFVKVIATEHDFRVPILDDEGKQVIDPVTNEPVWYVGRIDGIVQDEFGNYWLLEHKTAKAFNTEKLPLDEQCGSYIWAAQQIYGYKLEGVIYNVIRKKLPTVPEELKKGGLSQNKSMDTTWQVYYKALIEHYGGKENVPMEQYKPFLEMLYEKGNPFFLRTRVHRNQYEIVDIGRRIYREWLDMTRADLHLYPNPTQDCMWDCDFRSVCLAMNDGSDYQFMIDGMFEQRKVSTAESVGDE